MYKKGTVTVLQRGNLRNKELKTTVGMIHYSTAAYLQEQTVSQHSTTFSLGPAAPEIYTKFMFTTNI